MLLRKNSIFEERDSDMEACKLRKKMIKVNVKDKRFEEGYEELSVLITDFLEIELES